MKTQYFAIPLFLFVILGIISESLFLIILGFLMIPVGMVYDHIKVSNEKVKSDDLAEKVFSDNQITKYFIGKDGLSGLGISEADNKIYTLSRSLKTENFKLSTYSFEDLFEVKLIEDEETVISANRLSQLGGALVGGAAFGAVGAIVGGSGGKQHSKKEVRKINLELVFDSIDNPLFSVSFMNEDLFMKSYDPKYKEYFAEANKWYKSFTVILKRNELNRNH